MIGVSKFSKDFVSHIESIQSPSEPFRTFPGVDESQPLVHASQCRALYTAVLLVPLCTPQCPIAPCSIPLCPSVPRNAPQHPVVPRGAPTAETAVLLSGRSASQQSASWCPALYTTVPLSAPQRPAAPRALCSIPWHPTVPSSAPQCPLAPCSAQQCPAMPRNDPQCPAMSH